MTDKTLKDLDKRFMRFTGIKECSSHDVSYLNYTTRPKIGDWQTLSKDYADLASKQQARIEELEKQQEWQPIDTMPDEYKEEYVMSYHHSYGWRICHWCEESNAWTDERGYCTTERNHPTHWKPLDTQPPKEGE